MLLTYKQYVRRRRLIGTIIVSALLAASVAAHPVLSYVIFFKFFPYVNDIVTNYMLYL